MISGRATHVPVQGPVRWSSVWQGPALRGPKPLRLLVVGGEGVPSGQQRAGLVSVLQLLLIVQLLREVRAASPCAFSTGLP